VCSSPGQRTRRASRAAPFRACIIRSVVRGLPGFPLAGFITGAVLDINGGTFMG
jgi:hypothetical protein